MSKKEYFLIGLVVVLVGVYAVCFTDWFRPKIMRIEHSTRSLRQAWGSGGQRVDMTDKVGLGNVTFALHHNYKLTSVKVVPLHEFLTNKYVPPVWELVSKSGSNPIDGFSYGMDIQGMASARSALQPDPLLPGVEYRLLVVAGKVKGEHDFKVNSAGVVRR
jgi:hypothetical protein